MAPSQWRTEMFPDEKVRLRRVLHAENNKMRLCTDGHMGRVVRS